MNISQRRLLLILDCAQFAHMFPDCKDSSTNRARWILRQSPRDLYDFWCFLEQCDLLPDAACYAALRQYGKVTR